MSTARSNTLPERSISVTPSPPEETLAFWGKEAVLADVVWIIRSFRPDVIVTRFPVDRSSGHGHHTSSARLAREAFHAAGDPRRFPEQLDRVDPWQAKRLFWNGWRLSEQEQAEAVKVDVGEFDPLLGSSYSEIAAISRSMHKSQGFGAAGRRGTRFEYFKLVEGSMSGEELLSGIDTSWSRVPGGQNVEVMLGEIAERFDPRDPARSLPQLLEAYSEMRKLEPTSWVEVKQEELLELIQACAGLWLEAISTDFASAPGDSVTVNTTLINRSNIAFRLKSISFENLGSSSVQDVVLENNTPHTIESLIQIPDGYPTSQPYWLRNSPKKALFTVTDQLLIGAAENAPSLQAKITLIGQGEELVFVVPVLYRWTDRVDGESYRLFEVRPKVTVKLGDGVRVFADTNPQEIRVRVKANSPGVDGTLRLSGDSDWRRGSGEHALSLPQKYDEAELSFRVTPPDDAGADLFVAEADVGERQFSRAQVTISHPHIKRQVYFPESTLKVVKLDVERRGDMIGYIMGSGDEVGDGLRHLGYDVTSLSDDDLESADLSRFDAIVAGIRAYNTRERLAIVQPRLLRYVEEGGTLIVQYNVSRGLVTENVRPIPSPSGAIVLNEEDAPVTILAPDHPSALEFSQHDHSG